MSFGLSVSLTWAIVGSEKRINKQIDANLYISVLVVFVVNIVN